MLGQTKAIRVRDVEFGRGIPKICIPIVGKTREDVLNQAFILLEKKPDCIELRIDWYEDVTDTTKVLSLLQEIRSIIGNTVLLFTFRTKNEGGERDISVEAYKDLCEYVCKSGLVDMIDVEGYLRDGLLQELCRTAHEREVVVVASNHDFHKTPAEEEIVEKLHAMDKAGADIPKIALMPSSEKEVLTLLSATVRYRETGGMKPIITMSMGGTGMISRLTGEIFGSALTFAAGEEASAPGQIPIDEVKLILNMIHEHK